MSHVTYTVMSYNDSFTRSSLCVTWCVCMWHDSFVRDTSYSVVTYTINITWSEIFMQHPATHCNTLQHTDIYRVCHNWIRRVEKINAEASEYVTMWHVCDMTLIMWYLSCVSQLKHNDTHSTNWFVDHVIFLVKVTTETNAEASEYVTMWHDSFVCDVVCLYVKWLICTCHVSFSVWHTHNPETHLLLRSCQKSWDCS